MLSKAVEWGLIDEHPMRDVRRAKVDAIGRLRYLTPAEETRLRAALERARRGAGATAGAGSTRGARSAATRRCRTSARYPDHMTPIMLLALNTGLRRGELLGADLGAMSISAARC